MSLFTRPIPLSCLFGGLFLLLSLFCLAEPVAADDGPAAWDAMSVEQKLDTLKDSSLELNDDGTVASG
ncbi:MAG TPA: hypothetical protein VE890_09840, partial [Thermoguttaceae bacterium]|nr:hypothetical protein [Thermoguttaceae bacterium]